jgi:threonine aldolase
VPRVLDLRSDTVTKPTQEMRAAMANAEVGDDILRDDPTVIRLEEMAAELLGMEASLFTVSGTMSNEIAMMLLARPGEEVVVFADSHIYNLETGAMAALAGVQARPVLSTNGLYEPQALAQAILPEGVQRARTAVLCLENSFHLNRGLAIDPDDYADNIAAARKAGLSVFMDGARLFNAAVALDKPAADLVAGCDAAAFCLSKGLAAPIGSILGGTRAFIDEARRVKQRFGGGLRQGGVIAAPAIVGLEKMLSRLPVDHENAEALRAGLEKLGVKVDRDGLLTNIVNLDVAPVGMQATALADALAARGIKAKICTESTLRMVTHNDIGSADVETVLRAITEIANK